MIDTPDLWVDIYPNQAQYKLGEKVQIVVQMFSKVGPKVLPAEISVWREHAELVRASLMLSFAATDSTLTTWTFDLVSAEPWVGYGVDLVIHGEEADHLVSTAFDVATHPNLFPRMGFLSDFSPENEGPADVTELSKYHVNLVQFYDWMYRHDTLLAPSEIFLDPLGRQLSLGTIRQKIKACHDVGMQAHAYGAVYASSKEFHSSHEDWGIYRNDGKPFTLGDWLYIMNIAIDSPWSAHISNQFLLAIQELDFDGIHLDTYGFPKKYRRSDGAPKVEDWSTSLGPFVHLVRQTLESSGKPITLTFNAVGNWPSQFKTPLVTDATYVEVWDPLDKYRHLVGVVNQARTTSRKPVILAAYLSSFQKHKREELIYTQRTADYDLEAAFRGFRLAYAVIHACGGIHFLWGGKNGLLTNNYYVDHATVPREHLPMTRQYADFVVRYGALLQPLDLVDLSLTHSGGINQEFRFQGIACAPEPVANRVWTQIRERKDLIILNLVNLIGIESDAWDEGKPHSPTRVENWSVLAIIDEPILGIYYASPDTTPWPKPLEWSVEPANMRGCATKIVLPPVDYWCLVWIVLEPHQEAKG